MAQSKPHNTDSGNNVLLVKIEGLVWYTIYQIYHHLPVDLRGFFEPPLLIYQWEKDIYRFQMVLGRKMARNAKGMR